ncbi:hypothetical protein FRC07_002700 [Ceratobasidium sp. 392]|nr:hypothetical protein FRC07_002700 [Ceratobasidium sp. 392]
MPTGKASANAGKKSSNNTLGNPAKNPEPPKNSPATPNIPALKNTQEAIDLLVSLGLLKETSAILPGTLVNVLHEVAAHSELHNFFKVTLTALALITPKALNLERIWSSCYSPITFLERGPGIESLVNVLAHYLEGNYTEKPVLEKWLDDLVDAATTALSVASSQPATLEKVPIRWMMPRRRHERLIDLFFFAGTFTPHPSAVNKAVASSAAAEKAAHESHNALTTFVNAQGQWLEDIPTNCKPHRGPFPACQDSTYAAANPKENNKKSTRQFPTSIPPTLSANTIEEIQRKNATYLVIPNRIALETDKKPIPKDLLRKASKAYDAAWKSLASTTFLAE